MPSPDIALAMMVALLQVIVLVICAREKHYSYHPFFCFYLGYSIAALILRLWARPNTHLYFTLYWIIEAASGVLELLTLHEAFKPSLEMYYKVYSWVRLIPPLIALLIGGHAVWRAMNHPLGPGWLGAFGAGAYAFEIGVRVLEVGVFLLALKLARRRDHPIGQQHPFGIVIGFGVAASTALLADFVGLKFAFKFGYVFDTIFRYLPASGYIAAAVAWLITFATQERRRRRATPEEIQRRLDQQRNIAERVSKP